MSFQKFITNAVSEWMNGDGQDADIVISSRVRLARNLQDQPFPMLATDSQLEQVLGRVEQAMQDEAFKQQENFEMIRMDTLTPLQKRVLMEKHLISPNLLSESRKGAVILSENEAISIMVNEEDHLRIQCLFSGLQLREAWKVADRVDDIFEKYLDFAFDERRGFLTSCPTNVGTGIRASVMMHLPALVLTQQINRILSAITQVGLVVRGLYGEGSEAVGNLFQISNQITLGQSEEEIIENLISVARQIIDQERAAREYLMQNRRLQLEDRLCRSYGILTNARTIESKEAAERLSDVRLGIDLDIIRNVPLSVMNELMVMTQPGFLQQYAGQQLTPDSRDERRARLIRERLKSAME
ncbi:MULTISPECIES: protein arginine kinase [Aneurinibacillus]|uniref:Protein-arginine kinase n=1 Tax=Aneurinibacillus thermoaerophilus TaxID=143495 RepID=A0A1G8CTX3_ANETH|nr:MULTISPECIES: protein arginine kinase [Aneurinibacillus]AMA74484.1 ATP--guanido phosphotransferase [Aneurinibacillus sp. XH2]MED0677307.1 protein arginine kinase [Aneurinibacillus thermoaerophilus]MED0679071.1 protein arginine kinase [Aneurinibacillus thermoaerophilus]MED0738740.1 protein arginine kinase [Aneurinibacillus thermoaerophilus]MED0757841.1 protein arginine kinase [Aneurinibacillus thermoaerophilus]